MRGIVIADATAVDGPWAPEMTEIDSLPTGDQLLGQVRSLVEN
jgi:hypothetical protein